MKFAINLKKQIAKAHLWDDGDTYCKMYSTGGLKIKRMSIVDDKQDREICQMCKNVFNTFNPLDMYE